MANMIRNEISFLRKIKSPRTIGSVIIAPYEMKIKFVIYSTLKNNKKKKPRNMSSKALSGRSDGTWTHDLLLPKQAL